MAKNEREERSQGDTQPNARYIGFDKLLLVATCSLPAERLQGASLASMIDTAQLVDA